MPQIPDDYDDRDAGWLVDELRQRDRQVAELRDERDAASQLVGQMRERLEDNHALIESWIEAFELQIGDDGLYHWPSKSIRQEHDRLIDDYNALLRDWNKHVASFNAVVAPKEVGRPLAASDAQCVEVRKLHKRGASLREIADDTSLTLRTVRTILGRDTRTDRTSVKRLTRIDPDRAAMNSHKARRRTRDALPNQIGEAIKTNVALLKAAKGI